MITEAQLKAIMPYIGSRATEFLSPINVTLEEFDILTLPRMSAFIANLAHESGSFRYMEEIADGSAYNNRADLGNTKPEAIEISAVHGSTPGRWWKGHGPIQITGYNNHLACGEFLGIDLLNFPRLLCEPLHGCRGAGWFWMVNRLNEVADLENYDEVFNEFDKVADLINRGRKTDRIGDSNGWPDRVNYYRRALTVLA